MSDAMDMPRDLRLVVENLQDSAAARELESLAGQLAGDFPEAAHHLRQRARHLFEQAEHRRRRAATVARGALA